ncbi:hypothetical protein HDU93_009276 [Gonapodya sp. JEL0774]|nr:hypothetical protein HDU93_009276 [Gonapodya sp. JEL0774]
MAVVHPVGEESYREDGESETDTESNFEYTDAGPGKIMLDDSDTVVYTPGHEVFSQSEHHTIPIPITEQNELSLERGIHRFPDRGGGAQDDRAGFSTPFQETEMSMNFGYNPFGEDVLYSSESYGADGFGARADAPSADGGETDLNMNPVDSGSNRTGAEIGQVVIGDLNTSLDNTFVSADLYTNTTVPYEDGSLTILADMSFTRGHRGRDTDHEDGIDGLKQQYHDIDDRATPDIESGFDFANVTMPDNNSSLGMPSMSLGHTPDQLSPQPFASPSNVYAFAQPLDRSDSAPFNELMDAIQREAIGAEDTQDAPKEYKERHVRGQVYDETARDNVERPRHVDPGIPNMDTHPQNLDSQNTQKITRTDVFGHSTSQQPFAAPGGSNYDERFDFPYHFQQEQRTSTYGAPQIIYTARQYEGWDRSSPLGGIEALRGPGSNTASLPAASEWIAIDSELIGRNTRHRFSDSFKGESVDLNVNKESDTASHSFKTQIVDMSGHLWAYGAPNSTLNQGDVANVHNEPTELPANIKVELSESSPPNGEPSTLTSQPSIVAGRVMTGSLHANEQDLINFHQSENAYSLRPSHSSRRPSLNVGVPLSVSHQKTTQRRQNTAEKLLAATATPISTGGGVATAFVAPASATAMHNFADDRMELIEDDHQDGASDEKKHVCRACGIKFNRSHNLKSHMLTHTGERPFKCENCELSFSRLHDLRRHKRLHTGERPHVCAGCDKSFARRDALRRHKRSGQCTGGITMCSDDEIAEGGRLRVAKSRSKSAGISKSAANFPTTARTVSASSTGYHDYREPEFSGVPVSVERAGVASATDSEVLPDDLAQEPFSGTVSNRQLANRLEIWGNVGGYLLETDPNIGRTFSVYSANPLVGAITSPLLIMESQAVMMEQPSNEQLAKSREHEQHQEEREKNSLVHDGDWGLSDSRDLSDSESNEKYEQQKLAYNSGDSIPDFGEDRDASDDGFITDAGDLEGDTALKEFFREDFPVSSDAVAGYPDIGKNIQLGEAPTDMKARLEATGKESQSENIIGSKSKQARRRSVKNPGDLVGRYNEPEGGVVPKTASEGELEQLFNPEFADEWGVDNTAKSQDKSYGGRSSNEGVGRGKGIEMAQEIENRKRAEGKGPEKALLEAKRQGAIDTNEPVESTKKSKI